MVLVLKDSETSKKISSPISGHALYLYIYKIKLKPYGLGALDPSQLQISSLISSKVMYLSKQEE
jgi:hypothetical protein